MRPTLNHPARLSKNAPRFPLVTGWVSIWSVKKSPLTAVLLFATALGVFAADAPSVKVRPHGPKSNGKVSHARTETSLVDFVMKQADTNKDGKISRAEAKNLPTGTDEKNKGKMRRLLLDFDTIDANHDGEIARAELVRCLDPDLGLQTFVQDTTVKPVSSSKIQDPSDSITDVGLRYKF